MGYIAGKLSKTGKVGVVGGQDSETINDFIVGYEAGAKYANPDCAVEVQYANDFEDPAKGKECALALYGLGCDIVYQVAGKTGEGVPELLRAVIERIPHPVLLDERGASALIFDSNYDAYRGVVNYVRVKNGSFKRGTKIRLFNNGIESEVKEVGFFGPEMRADEELAAGSVGYLIPNLKSPADTKMGDTITDIKDPDIDDPILFIHVF